MKERLTFFCCSPLFWLLIAAALYITYYQQLNISGFTTKHLTEAFHATEFLWRIIWGLASIASLMLSLLSIGYSFHIIDLNLQAYLARCRETILLIVAFITIILGSVFFTNLLSFSDKAVSTLIKTADINAETHVYPMTNFTMAMTVIAAFLLCLSSTSLLLRQPTLCIKEMKQKYAFFRKSFYITSLFLGIGIIQLYLLFAWASHATATSFAAANEIKLALSLSGAIIFSLIFIICFVPVSIYFTTWVNEIAESDSQNTSPEAKQQWRQTYGFLDTPLKRLTDLGVLLSPILIGALANLKF